MEETLVRKLIPLIVPIVLLEMGLLAASAFVVALVMPVVSEPRRAGRAAACFLVPLAVIAAATYGPVLRAVGWHVLVEENYRLLSKPQLQYFSRHLSGFNDWPKTGWTMLAAACVFLLWCGLSGWLASLRRRSASGLERRDARRAGATALVGALGLAVLAFDLGLHADANPLPAAPLVLLAAILGLAWRAQWGRGALSRVDASLLVLATCALASITRVVFNVSPKSPYAPFTLPLVIIVYAQLIFRVSPALLLQSPQSRKRARRIALTLGVLVVVVVTCATIRRYRYSRTYPIDTARGRLWTTPELGQPLAEALGFVAARTAPGDAVLPLPQGTLVNFLSERPYPLRQENVVPGFIEGADEAAAIARIRGQRVPVVLLINHLTPEYRDRAFGVDYDRDLVAWIREHYRLQATFCLGCRPNPELGDRQPFILVYQR